MLKRNLILIVAALFAQNVFCCTNFIVTAGASASSTTLVTYAADSHALYGALYHHTGGKSRSAVRKIFNWDTGKYLCDIDEVAETFTTNGNMNEHSLIITETTWGGRPELEDKTGKIDYGSLIYVTLERARTAREAILQIAELAQKWGYCSEGESFSIADGKEAWIMELIGKGFKPGASGENLRKGIVWVARRIPDGYVSGHANQARISTFPLDDKENCLYSKDVISFAREMGWYSGEDASFSFCDTYNPIDFGTIRGCDARVWAFFNHVTTGMDRYLDYAMGYNLKNRIPLWVKPSHKITRKQLFDMMRDHYEGTPMDMTTDIGAGGSHCPYRWRPMEYKVDGKTYINERATATQQTGFWMCGEARLERTGILWFGVDDAATSALTPIYCSCKEVPWCISEKNGSMLKYSATSLFWLSNRISNFAYLRYDTIAPVVRKNIDQWENNLLEQVDKVDRQVAGLSPKKRIRTETEFSVNTANSLFYKWKALDEYLLVKFIDGNEKGEDKNGFIDNGAGVGIPGKIIQKGYSQHWKEMVVKDNGEELMVR